MRNAMNLIGLCSLLVVLSIIPMVGFDVIFQLYSHFKKLRMSRQDIRDEYKQMEGDPHVKGRLSQRAYHIVETVAYCLVADFFCRLAYSLHHKGYCPCSGVGVGDGQRDALAMLVGTDNNEMPGTARACYQRRLYHKLHHLFREMLFLYNFIHCRNVLGLFSFFQLSKLANFLPKPPIFIPIIAFAQKQKKRRGNPPHAIKANALRRDNSCGGRLCFCMPVA